MNVKELIKLIHEGKEDEYWGFVGYDQFHGATALLSDLCESPVERLMYWTLVAEFGAYAYWSPEMRKIDDLILDKDPFSKTAKIELMSIIVQPEIQIEKYAFRPDFGIFIFDTKKKIPLKFYLEIDGHQFHEKTKEQVQKGKWRDRLFLSNGLDLIHFSGSEVFKNAHAVWRETFNIIEKKLAQ